MDSNLSPRVVAAMIVVERLAENFDLWTDLASHLGDEVVRTLPVPSNSIWDQFWCVVGARQSYARAMAVGVWQGVSCSLTPSDRGHIGPLVQALKSSRERVEAMLADAYDSLVLDLLLHETQHQGQLVRYVYGLGIDFPDSWRRRWNLT